MAKLKNKKRELFCQEWLIDLNATQSAIRAGYSENTANEQGARLLTYTDVQTRIAELMEERMKRLQITQERVLEELAIIAYSDITDFMEVKDVDVVVRYEKDKNGEDDKNKPIIKTFRSLIILQTSEMPPDKTGAIAQIKQTRDGLSLKLHDKVRALEDLGRHTGVFTDKEALELKKKELELKGW